MESVGRLAGGVAHDFNNKLSVILGYAQMAMENLNRTDPLYGNLQQVLKAGKQSVDIVRQILAFAREQIISPVVLDLNETVEDMLKMLRRLIGEDIDLVWSPGHDLWQWKDMGYGAFSLNFIKNKEQQEVDFVIANDGKPVVLIEAKRMDVEPSKALRKFQDFLQTPAVQLVEEANGYRLIPNGAKSILVAPACQWLSTLP
jgi:signal transduction histidine kinase